MSKDPYRLSLVAQVTLYLIPGFIFFIFIPAIVVMMFEDWSYNIAVYYSFVTITTIGFGDYVAGVNRSGMDTWPYTVYRLCLLVWMISGVGYSIMIIGFITKAMRSRRVHDLGHSWVHRIKKTPYRIREELRNLIREALLVNMKKEYTNDFVYVPRKPERTHSCPDLTIFTSSEQSAMKRKRAQSACVGSIMSTSMENEEAERSDLIMRVAAALSDVADAQEREQKEKQPNGHLENRRSSSYSTNLRQRSNSEITFMGDDKSNEGNRLNWYQTPSELQPQRGKDNSNDEKKQSPSQLTVSHTSGGVLGKLRGLIFGSRNKYKSEHHDVERQDYVVSRFNRRASDLDHNYFHQAGARRKSASVFQDRLLEETSVADLIRVLNPDALPSASHFHLKRPSVQFSTSGTPKVQSRRGSLLATTPRSGRRHSLRPSSLLHHSGPPPYTPLAEESDGNSPTETVENHTRINPAESNATHILTEKL